MIKSAKSVRLGDLLRIKHGFAFKGAHFTASGSDLILTPGNFCADGGLQFRAGKEKFYKGSYPSDFLLKPGDLLVVMTDLTQQARILGAPAKITGGHRLLHNQRLGKVTNLSACIDEGYLYHLFNGPNFRQHLISTATGSTVKHTAPERIYSFQFDLPPVPTQRRIADILSAYDDLIENNTRRIAILEDMARRLFEEWFLPDGRIKDAVPVRIDALIDFDPKTKVAKDGWKPFLPMPCVPTNSMVVSNWEEREGNSGSKFLNGDTLLARITPCLENGKTAFVDFLPGGTAGFGSTEFIVMRGRSVPPEFVYCLARSDAFREHAIKSMSGATGRQRVSSAAVAQFEIASPHLERLNQFSDAARPMFAMVRSLADANTNLRTTRDLLLPKLISGDIEVRAAEEALEAVAA